MSAFGASNFGGRDYRDVIRRHSAYSVMMIKIAKAGKSTKSKHPTIDDNPTILRRITSAGVKQHIAATIVPITPVESSWSLIARLSIYPINILVTSHSHSGAVHATPVAKDATLTISTQ